jgi:replicative DNA helicase
MSEFPHKNVLERYNFHTISQAYDKASKVINDKRLGITKPFKTPWKRLNKALGGGLLPGTNYIIGGRPGVGKSAFSNALIFGVTKYADNNEMKYIVLYWTFEMPSYQQIIRQLSYELKMSVQQLHSSDRYLEEEYMHAIEDNKDLFDKKNVYFNSTSTTAETVYTVNRECHLEYPDHQIINILDHSRLISSSTKTTEEERITKLLTVFTECARQYDSINIVLSQLNRNIESNDRIRNPIPYLSDYFGSDAVGQFGNVCIILQRPEMYNIQEYCGVSNPKNMLFAHIVKNRDGDICFVDYDHQLSINTIIERPS